MREKGSPEPGVVPGAQLDPIAIGAIFLKHRNKLGRTAFTQRCQ